MNDYKKCNDRLVNETKGCTLTITERNGPRFKGVHSYKRGWDAEISGQVLTGGKLEYRFVRWIRQEPPLPPGEKVKPLDTLLFKDARLVGE